MEYPIYYDDPKKKICILRDIPYWYTIPQNTDVINMEEFLMKQQKNLNKYTNTTKPTHTHVHNHIRTSPHKHSYACIQSSTSLNVLTENVNLMS